jgi:hypothetical protein
VKEFADAFLSGTLDERRASPSVPALTLLALSAVTPLPLPLRLVAEADDWNVAFPVKLEVPDTVSAVPDVEDASTPIAPAPSAWPETPTPFEPVE